MLFKRIKELGETHNRDFANAYAEAGGDHVKAKRILRSKLRETYGLDPATILVLVQLAIRIWKWAKDHGYLTKYEPSQACLNGCLEAMALDGDLDD